MLNSNFDRELKTRFIFCVSM